MTIPFLESIPEFALAANASGSLKRVIFYTFHNAWYDDHVFPASTNYLIGPEGVRYIPLNSLTGDISKLFTAAKYGALKSKMNIMRGFDVTSASEGGGGHRSLYTLCASDERSMSAVKDSIDTVIGNSSAFYPNVPFRRYMNAITVNDGRDAYNHAFQNGSLRSQLGGPKAIFTDFFSEALPTLGGSTTVTTTPEDTNLSRRLAMNAIVNKISGLSQSSKLSAVDKQKLTQHADLINKLLPSLAAPASSTSTTPVGSSCTKPTLAAGINESKLATSGVSNRLKVMMDLVFMAMNCQLTNVFTLQPYHCSDDGSLQTDGNGESDVYHQLAGHHYDPPKYLPAKNFILDHLLYLINKMEGTRESNGLTMLDNSLIVVISNDGCSNHSSWDIPVITFGSLGGSIKTGNYINYQRPETPSNRGGLDLVPAPDASGNYSHIYNFNYGRPLGTLYNTILNALKISHSGFGEYANPGGMYAPWTTIASRQASLPILT